MILPARSAAISLSKSTQAALSRQYQRRLAHQLTPLRTPVEKGLLPLYSPTALAHLHGAHLKTLLDDVNRLAPAAYLDDAPLFRIMYQTATQPRHAALFNSATQAWNYEFFLEALSPAYAAPSDSASGSTVVNEPTLLTKQRLEEDFGSVQTFFRDFEARAMGMFGSGWIWLVTDDQKQMRVLTTYNSGNPITLMLRNQNAVKVAEEEAATAQAVEQPQTSQASPSQLFGNYSYRKNWAMKNRATIPATSGSLQELLVAIDGAPRNIQSEQQQQQQQQQQEQSSEGQSNDPNAVIAPSPLRFKDSLAYSKQRPVGAYVPILALNMWEHAYLRDYGLDRERYVKNFWQNVDWSVVHKRLFRQA